MRDDAPDELLDDYRLDGTLPMRRVIMPERNALLVDEASTDDAVKAVGVACQQWAGASYILVPCARDADRVPPEYKSVEDGLVEEVWTREVVQDFKFRGTDRRVKGFNGETFLLSTIYASRYKRDDWRRVIQALPAPDDPWFAAYLAALGQLPERPDPRLLDIHNFRPDVEWDTMFAFEVQHVPDPGPLDLLTRLRDPAQTSPVARTMLMLGVASAPRAADFPSAAVLPKEGALASEFGPNLVIVYTPGDTRDLCAIWNLRAANGLPSGLPLGLPDGDDTPAALNAWAGQYAQTMWGVRSTRMALVSTSVSKERLAEVAAAAEQDWEVVDFEDVMRLADRPGRVSSELVTFRDGIAEVQAFDPEDRSELAQHVGGFRTPHATVRFSRTDRHVPPLRVLDHDYPFNPAYRGGGFEYPGARYDQMIQLRWPAGWTALVAVAHDRGLRVERSTAGQAAEAFLRHLQGWPGTELLLSRDVVEMLYRLGERAGMTWFRDKVRDIGQSASGGDEEAMARLESKLSEVTLAPSDHEQHTVTYSRLVSLLGRDAAEPWLSWAERQGIVLRGVDVGCEHCGARGWRPMADLAPPMTCRGCGRGMHRPFRPSDLTFRYRAAETLLRVLEHDALVHVFTMRYFARLFEPHFDRPGLVYGMYPGVDFYERDSGARIGEADVVLLTSDGSLVAGECKRRGAGLTDGEIAKLDALAERIGAPWTFLATTDVAAECPPIWAESQRALPEPPRFSLSAEQLFESHVIWALGATPLAWTSLGAAAHAQRELDFRASLPDAVSWLLGRRRYDEAVLAEAQAALDAATDDPLAQ